MRLDNYLVEKEYFSSRTKAQQAIERGEVYINGKAVYKNSLEIDVSIFDLDNKIRVICESSYVSLGGYKLAKALNDFNYNVNNKVCADVGASTGGFTDCLLQNSALKVYAIDLNDELLDIKLKNNNKVIPLIKNAKDLKIDDFTEKVDLIVADLSFISEKIIMPVLANLLDEDKDLIILIKPQFELDKKVKLKNGIVKDPKVWLNVIKNIYDLGISLGLSPINLTFAPINQEKNREFLILFRKGKHKICDINPKKLMIK